MGEASTVQALRRELLSTGSASAEIATLTMTPEQWRSAARKIARAERRTVRTFAGTTLHAILTDWPANDTEDQISTQRLRRGMEDRPAHE
ncbi:hypothetical protein [uncultured Serinicoccus sp.]|uniref:hypothetical protein n=1 Tax=uncultured Serinicoccus sp. TaxID=735514 RepID=UPI00260EB79B|nr:hypothetical protein [uncultured Serinicoccus sp.]